MNSFGDGIVATVIVLVLLLFPSIPSATAQSSPPVEPYARFSPSMAIIIAVLVTALFFMGFFSIYIRRCSDSSGGSVRPILSIRSRRAPAARGLDPAVIETYPTFAYSVVKGLKIGKGALECAVCLNEFEDDETLRLIPKCDHVFHPECIDAWLNSHVTCPVCRANLVPQPGDDSVDHQNELDTPAESTLEVENGDVSIRVAHDDATIINDNITATQEHLPPPAELINNRNPSTRWPPRARSIVRPRMFERFRSHSTGHSLVQPGENVDRYTLRLPEDVRKQVMKRALLTRTASTVVVLPREGSTRKGFRTGRGESSSRGRSYRRLESLDRVVRSDRWVFTRAPSFLTRAFSVRSQKAVAPDGASTSSASPRDPKMAVKDDQTGLVSGDSARPPV